MPGGGTLTGHSGPCRSKKMALNLLEPSSFQLRVDIQVLPAMGFELLPKAASELDCWPVPVPVLSGWQSPCQ